MRAYTSAREATAAGGAAGSMSTSIGAPKFSRVSITCRRSSACMVRVNPLIPAFSAALSAATSSTEPSTMFSRRMLA
jgi:hypothetical protein